MKIIKIIDTQKRIGETDGGKHRIVRPKFSMGSNMHESAFCSGLAQLIQGCLRAHEYACFGQMCGYGSDLFGDVRRARIRDSDHGRLHCPSACPGSGAQVINAGAGSVGDRKIVDQVSSTVDQSMEWESM